MRTRLTSTGGSKITLQSLPIFPILQEKVKILLIFFAVGSEVNSTG